MCLVFYVKLLLIIDSNDKYYLTTIKNLNIGIIFTLSIIISLRI